MKTITAVLILSALTPTCIAQGTVNFRNSVQFQTVDPSGLGRKIYDWNTGPLGGTQFVAELYAGTDAGSLVPLTSSISRFRSTTSANKGWWSIQTINGLANDAIVLPGWLPGQIGFLQVKAWDYSDSLTYEGANGKGPSIVFTYRVPSPGDPPFAFYMEGFQGFISGFYETPEPSVIVLAICGIGVCFWFAGESRAGASTPDKSGAIDLTVPIRRPPSAPPSVRPIPPIAPHSHRPLTLLPITDH